MPDPATLGLFALASLALLLTPGPAVFYITTRTIDQGRSAGVASALGLGVGTLFHVAAAVVGISALLASSAVAFGITKYLGAAYLIFLGIQKLRTPEAPENRSVAGGSSRPLRAFYEGVVVNILNPKTALFFLAFLPQFTDPRAGAVAGQILLLGVLFVALSMGTYGLYVLLAGTAARRLRGSTRARRVERWLAGVVYIGLGLLTAFTGTRRTVPRG